MYRHQAHSQRLRQESLGSHFLAILADDSVQTYALAVIAGLILGLAVIAHL